MSNRGDDCYFYFYSTCTKGDSCPYRHCEAALGNETVCVLWQEGRCFRSFCRFRHMEIEKKRSEIPCYWENQPAGCQKLNCAFHHNKERFVDGHFLPPSKNQLSEEGDESKMPIQQSSLEVPDGLRVVSTQKSMISTKQDKDGNLNFGIKTLEEIKSEKMKEKSKQQPDCPSEVAAQTQTHPGPEEKNVQTVVRTVTLSTKQGEEPRIQLTLAERLGKRKPPIVAESGLPLKRRLAERLGKNIDSLENIDKTPKRVQVPKSLKERLGLPFEQSNMETENVAKPAVEICVKTLEEIRMEKASQRKGEIQPKPKVTVSCTADDSSPGAKPSPAIRIKTFSEVLAEKKQRQINEERVKSEKESPPKPKHECVSQKQGSIVLVPVKRKLEEPSGNDKDFGEVRKKIKQETLRMQQNVDDPAKTQPQPERTPAGRRLLCIAKSTAPGKKEKPLLESTSSSRASTAGPTVKPLNDNVSNSHSKVHVKSLEEIRKEKQCLKQQQERKPQEEKGAVAPAGEEKEQAKALMTTNPESPVRAGKTHPLRKRLLERSQETAPKKLRSEESSISPQLVEQRMKGKPKVNVKPSGVKTLSPAKQALKHKASESHPSVAAVKPLSPIPCTEVKALSPEHTTLTSAPGLPEESVAAVHGTMCTDRSELHACSQATPMLQAEIASPTSSQPAVETCRLSSTGTGETSCAADDDFEKLICEILGDELEAEIDLDPGKDEDDLLRELSEMIDS